MSLARKVSKAAVLPLGLATRRRSGDLVVLAYHRVGAGEREVDLPLDVFRKQLDVLHERDTVLSLDEALEDPVSGVVLTFDDGTRDFHDHVVPLAVERGMPVLLYLATSFVAGQGGLSDADAALDWGMLREAVDTGLVTIGSHTHSHINLAKARESEAEAEMLRSKALIEERLGVPCRHFAYPWGVGSVDAQAVAAKHFDSASLDGWKTNRRGELDPQRLGRTPVMRSDGVFFFRAKSKGLLDPEALLYRALGRGPWVQS